MTADRTVSFDAVVDENGHAGFWLKQGWIEGGNDEVKFDLSCGAGLGLPLMRLVVEVDGRMIVEQVDIVEGLTAWVDRLVDEIRGST